MTIGLQNYLALIQLFLNGMLGAKDFRHQYLQEFKHGAEPMSDDEFYILDKLFADTDNFSDDQELRREFPGEHIQEEELRTCAQQALEDLLKLQKTQ